MKSKRFEPIQEIASTSAKDLSRAMAEAGRKVADIESQLERLQAYRDEYVRNSTQVGRGNRMRSNCRTTVRFWSVWARPCAST